MLLCYQGKHDWYYDYLWRTDNSSPDIWGIFEKNMTWLFLHAKVQVTAVAVIVVQLETAEQGHKHKRETSPLCPGGRGQEHIDPT